MPTLPILARAAASLALFAAASLLAACGPDAEVVGPSGGSDADWNVSRYQLRAEGGGTFSIPDGTILRPGTYLVIIQGTTEEDTRTFVDNFLAFYQQTRSDDLILLDTRGAVQVRGVQFSFLDNEGDLLDGPAPAAGNDEDWQRLRGDYDADDVTAWERSSGGSQTSPGWGQEERFSPDYPYISEVSDGSDVHPFFSFVEIYLGAEPDEGGDE